MGRLDGVGRRRLRQRTGLRRRLQLQYLAHPSGVLAVGGMPQAEVAHLMEAARRHVLEEAAHELGAAGRSCGRGRRR